MRGKYNISRTFIKKELICYLYTPLLAVSAIYVLLNVIHRWRPDLDYIAFYFVLNKADLNTNIFLSSYTHLGGIHFISNFIMYLILFLVIYDLLEDKRTLSYLMVLSLLILPFVTSLLFIQLPDTRMGMGLSGIISCLWGYAIILEYRYAKKNPGLNLDFQCLMIVVSFSLLLPLLYYRLYYWPIPFLALIYFLINRREGLEENWLILIEKIKQHRPARRIPYDALRLALPFTVPFTFLPIGGFVGKAGIIVHMAGWAYGMIIGYLLLDPDGLLSGDVGCQREPGR